MFITVGFKRLDVTNLVPDFLTKFEFWVLLLASLKQNLHRDGFLKYLLPAKIASSVDANSPSRMCRLHSSKKGQSCL